MLCQKLAQPKEEKHSLKGPGRPANPLLSSLVYRAGIMAQGIMTRRGYGIEPCVAHDNALRVFCWPGKPSAAVGRPALQNR